MVATEDIKYGELICFIPEEVFITVEMGKQTPIVKYLYDNKLMKDGP